MCASTHGEDPKAVMRKLKSSRFMLHAITKGA